MEPISVAAGTAGAAFLTEAVKFLWSEAGKILDRYHKHREAAAAKEAAELRDPAPADLDLPDVRTIDFAVVERRREELRTLLRDLALYANGADPISPSDEFLLGRIDELQRVLVEIFGLQTPKLSVSARMKTRVVGASGEVIGVDVHGVSGGTFQAEVDADSVRGKLTGVRIDDRKR